MLRKIVVTILILIDITYFFTSNICLPLVELCRYFDSDLFYKTEATIIDKYTEYHKGGRFNYSRDYITIEYMINGQIKKASIYAVKSDIIGEKMTIVISRNEWYKYRIPLKYTWDDLRDITIFILGICPIVYLLTEPANKLSRKQINNENNIKIEDLLKFYHRNINDNKNDCDYIKKYLKSVKATKLYNDFSLVIENVQIDELIECGFLLRKNSGGEFDFSIKTKEFWDRRHLQDHLVLRKVEDGYIVYSIRDDSIYFYNEKTYKYEFVTTSLIKYLIMIKENKFSIGYIGND
ncbi:MAG: hypothetical protein IJ661_12315 [Lachnospiraceae bacterium]|nr:hypothetical protein [Lachnospiraceae bacterium]